MGICLKLLFIYGYKQTPYRLGTGNKGNNGRLFACKIMLKTY